MHTSAAETAVVVTGQFIFTHEEGGVGTDKRLLYIDDRVTLMMKGRCKCV